MDTVLEDAHRGKAEALFAARLDKSGPPNAYTGTPCWEWTRGKVTCGYGIVRVAGRLWVTSRLAYALAHGSIRCGFFVLHKCHNPPCCRPDHLRQGTRQDNADDMTAAHRQAMGDRSSSRLHPERRPRGEGSKSAKLTDALVAEIREARASGEYGTSIAARLGMSHGTIYRVANRKIWTHLP